MGYNTVAFVLNDHGHTLTDSPKTVAWMLAHPPGFARDEYMRQQYRLAAEQFGEPMPHPQALEVLPTFHADQTQFFRAGGNCIKALEVAGYRKVGGKETVMLYLPDWAVRARHR